MMNFALYSVYDAKKREFSLPFAAANEEEALRMFYVQMSTNQIMRICDKDFDLYKVGEMFTNTGELFGFQEIDDTGLFVEGENFVSRYEKGEFIDGEQTV